MKYKTLTPIQVGAHSYNITLLDAYVVSEDVANMGDACHQNTELRIATKTQGGKFRAGTVVEVTLLHELIHAINETYNCKLEEDQVETLSQGLLQILKQYGIKLIECS